MKLPKNCTYADFPPSTALHLEDVQKAINLLRNMQIDQMRLATRIPPMAVPYGMKIIPYPPVILNNATA
jgi:hypothetical protein